MTHSATSHPVQIIGLTAVQFLQKSAFFGVRAFVVLYMVTEIGIGDIEALRLYKWFAGSIMISYFLGGIVGDLAIGSRRAAIMGSGIQAIGAFTLCVSSSSALYAGLICIAIGDALYSPNLLAQTGKLYTRKYELANAGFAILYAGVNLGAFLGVAAIGSLFGIANWVGFSAAGLLSLLAAGLHALLPGSSEIPEALSASRTDLAPILLIGAGLLLAVFWGMYELGGTHMAKLGYAYSELTVLESIGNGWLHSISSGATLLFCLLAIGFWSILRIPAIINLLLASAAMMGAYLLLLDIPETPDSGSLLLLIGSTALIAIAEIGIVPVVNGLVSKYGNPRLYGLIFGGLTFGVTLVGLIAHGHQNGTFMKDQNLPI